MLVARTGELLFCAWSFLSALFVRWVPGGKRAKGNQTAGLARVGDWGQERLGSCGGAKARRGCEKPCRRLIHCCPGGAFLPLWHCWRKRRWSELTTGQVTGCGCWPRTFVPNRSFSKLGRGGEGLLLLSHSSALKRYPFWRPQCAGNFPINLHQFVLSLSRFLVTVSYSFLPHQPPCSHGEGESDLALSLSLQELNVWPCNPVFPLNK